MATVIMGYLHSTLWMSTLLFVLLVFLIRGAFTRGGKSWPHFKLWTAQISGQYTVSVQDMLWKLLLCFRWRWCGWEDFLRSLRLRSHSVGTEWSPEAFLQTVNLRSTRYVSTSPAPLPVSFTTTCKRAQHKNKITIRLVLHMNQTGAASLRISRCSWC